MSTLEFGSISVTPLLDSSIRVPGDHLMRVGAAHFPVLPGHRGLAAEDWAAHPEHLDADGLFHMHFGGYLVRAWTATAVDVAAARRVTAMKTPM